MNINQHFSNLATKAAQDGADASQVISQRNRLFQDKVVPAPIKLTERITAWRIEDIEAWMASKGLEA